MFVNQHTDIAGNITLFDPADSSRTLIIPASVDQVEREAQIAAFSGPDLSLPDSIPMDRVEMFLAATNQLDRVESYIKSLGPVAMAQYRRAREFVPASPFGQVLKAALLPKTDTPDADYAVLCRKMTETTVDDYGAPPPSLLNTIAKFLFGG